MHNLLALTLLASIALAAITSNEPPSTKYDYRQSFKKPYITGPGMKPPAGATPQNSLIPHFQTNGFAHPAQDRVRLVPGSPNNQGSVWCSEPNSHKEWIVSFSFASSAPPTVPATGGEGFGFWYAKDPNQLGPLYGSKDLWTGLMIGMDTAHIGRRYVPLIYGYNSEHGTHKLEGSLRAPPENYSGFLGKCFRDYRNTPHKVFARVSYIGKTLKLEMDLTQEGKAYSECFSASNVNLPIGYHFGISASTSQFTHDDHDVFSFEVYEANPSEKASKPEENQGLPSDPEQLKKIQQVTELVNNVEAVEFQEAYPNGFEEAFSVTNLQILLQNQEKMINSINLVGEKLGLAPIIAATLAKNHYDRLADIILSQVDGKAGHLVERVDSMIAKADAISNAIRTLTQTIHTTYASGDASIKAVGEALERQNLQLDSTVELAKTTTVAAGSDGNGWFMYLAFFTVGGGVFAAVRNAISSGRSSNSGTVLGY
ncbi:UNVERIFIED_CONTAM: hypothetical protein HDU68_001743 [Siphonaria sp. JEL0065]|nr:hypothetical protein HDU68_001743 [Siphonaria sp. JEL0065]